MYQAPEGIENIDATSPKLDMFAFGIILYQLISDEYPFNNLETDYKLQHSILHDDPKPLIKPVSAFIQEFITRLLDKKPENRPDAKTILERDEMQDYIQKVIS